MTYPNAGSDTTVYNLAGEVVSKGKTINIPSNAKGIYIIKTNGKSTKVVK